MGGGPISQGPAPSSPKLWRRLFILTQAHKHPLTTVYALVYTPVDMKMVRVDDRQHERMVERMRRVGTPIAETVRRALDQFLGDDDEEAERADGRGDRVAALQSADRAAPVVRAERGEPGAGDRPRADGALAALMDPVVVAPDPFAKTCACPPGASAYACAVRQKMPGRCRCVCHQEGPL